MTDHLNRSTTSPFPPIQRLYVWLHAITRLWSAGPTAPTRRAAPRPRAITGSPPDVVTRISIIIATLDRPAALRACLQSLRALPTNRALEIIVVDNNPSSGLTPPVVDEFPGVMLIDETRRGLSYARNAGFMACTGSVAITVDDDVLFEAEWLERLLAPFDRPDVMIVTGGVRADRPLAPFGIHAGPGCDQPAIEANSAWFQTFRWCAVPTWQLGTSTNAAFRTRIFAHPHIGLMEEALGPGMPAGAGSDDYLFYRALKAGYTIIHRPDACVRHTRRIDHAEQIMRYAQGHVAYHLVTLLRDGDLRALVHLGATLPGWRLRQFWDRLRGRRGMPPRFLALEIVGNLLGTVALWRSLRRVHAQGRSGPFIPINLHEAESQEAGELSDEEPPHESRAYVSS